MWLDTSFQNHFGSIYYLCCILLEYHFINGLNQTDKCVTLILMTSIIYTNIKIDEYFLYALNCQVIYLHAFLKYHFTISYDATTITSAVVVNLSAFIFVLVSRMNHIGNWHLYKQ